MKLLLISSFPREQRLLLLLVGTSLLINNYDLGIFALALPQIQASLGIPESELGLYTGLARAGVLLAFPVAFMADVVGRQRLLIFTIVGMTLATVLSAFAQTAGQFILLQVFARCFSYAEEMICFVIVAEEIAADRRGRAFGLLAAIGVVGHGLSSLLYGQIEALPYGWRSFYILGALGLVVIMIARRRLKETRRFEEHRARRSPAQGLRDHLRPLASLVRAYPGRFFALIGTSAPFFFGIAAAFAFISKFLQETHGFSPAEVGYLQFFGGAISLLGFFVAGYVGDLVGRRLILGISVPLVPALFGVFYLTDDSTLLIGSWIGCLFFFFAAEITIAALGSELFPTSYRSTSSAARGVVNTVAGVIGLAAESFLFPMVGTHAAAILVLVAVTPFALIPVLFHLPETARRSLDEIAPEVETDLAASPGPFP